MGQCLKRSIAAGTEDMWLLLGLETPTKSTNEVPGGAVRTRQREAISRVGLVSDIDKSKVAGLTTVAKLEGASPPKFNSNQGADPTIP